MEVYIISYDKEREYPFELIFWNSKSSHKFVIVSFFLGKFSFGVIIYRSCQLNLKKYHLDRGFSFFNRIELEERRYT